MKKVKELKSRIAVVLMITLLSANMSPAALGAVFKKSMRNQEPVVEGINITEEEVRMSEGNEKVLTAEYVYAATTPEATSDNPEEEPGTKSFIMKAASASEITWKSNNESVVVIPGDGKGETCTVEAVGIGSATITASVTIGEETFTDTCSIRVKREELKASLTTSKIDYAKSVTVTAEVTTVEKNVDPDAVSFELIYDDYAFDMVAGDQDGRKMTYTLTPINGMSGTYPITVTAAIDGRDLKKELSLTVNSPKLALKVADDTKLLDVKGGQTAIISVDEEKSDDVAYGSYEWSVESLEPATEKVLSLIEENGDSATVEAKAAGKAVVKLTAWTSAKKGPRGIATQETEVTAQVTITVQDTREFFTEPKFIVLDINPDPEKELRTAEFKITNDYYDDDVEIEVIDETETVTAEFKEDAENIVVVSTDAEEIGSAKILVKRFAYEDTPEEVIEVPVIILTSAEPPTVENGLEVEIKGDAFDKKPTVNTGGITLNPEQAQKVDKDVSEQKQNIADKILEALTEASEEVLELLASKVSVSSDIAKEFGGAKDGEIVKVYPKQELNDVQMESIVTVNEDGTVEVKTIITKMVFDISLFMDRMDAQGNGYGASEDLGAEMTKSNNKKPVSFPVPLPQEGIKESARYAKVTHKGDVSYYPIEEEGGSKFVVISTTNFSPFEFEFVDSKPSAGKPSRGGGRSSAASTGKWSQDTLGWRYRGSNGIYATNEWKTLLWNGTMQWYRFSPEGYMVAGWFTDVDANKYFLHNISDGSQGKMYTGWNMIEGKWYYFKEYTGGPYGSLLVNGVTPDGYAVGADGVCLTFPGIVR